jgi:ribosomal protein L16 Arg81 hydroxylase
VGDLADPGLVYEHFYAGATIVLQSLHRFWPPLARLSRDLELALTHPVQVNAYVTPPASRGLGVHHDTHDVFVLQVHGRKHWDVHAPTAGPGNRCWRPSSRRATASTFPSASPTPPGRPRPPRPT